MVTRLVPTIINGQQAFIKVRVPIGATRPRLKKAVRKKAQRVLGPIQKGSRAEALFFAGRGAGILAKKAGPPLAKGALATAKVGGKAGVQLIKGGAKVFQAFNPIRIRIKKKKKE